jgi:hypothetical protein
MSHPRRSSRLTNYQIGALTENNDDGEHEDNEEDEKGKEDDEDPADDDDDDEDVHDEEADAQEDDEVKRENEQDDDSEASAIDELPEEEKKESEADFMQRANGLNQAVIDRLARGELPEMRAVDKDRIEHLIATLMTDRMEGLHFACRMLARRVADDSDVVWVEDGQLLCEIWEKLGDHFYLNNDWDFALASYESALVWTSLNEPALVRRLQDRVRQAREEGINARLGLVHNVHDLSRQMAELKLNNDRQGRRKLVRTEDGKEEVSTEREIGEKLARLLKDNTCKVCLEVIWGHQSKKWVALKHCYHLVCTECVIRLTDEKCPICRLEVVGWVNLWVYV